MSTTYAKEMVNETACQKECISVTFKDGDHVVDQNYPQEIKRLNVHGRQWKIRL